MQVRDIMTRDIDMCMPETSLREVARMMAEDDVGAIPVIDDRNSKHAIGIVTDRDITCRIVAKGFDATDKTARDAMTEGVEFVHPDTDIDEALRKMEQNQIRRLLVVDEGGRCCGIVAQADIAKRADAQKLSELVRSVSQESGKASKAGGGWELH